MERRLSERTTGDKNNNTTNEDLDTERIMLGTFEGKLDTQRVATAGFLNAIKQGDPVDSLSKYRFNALNVWNYRPANPTYDGLKQNGTLDLISNDSVRNKIIYHFDYVVSYLEDLRDSYHDDVNYAEKALLPYMGVQADSTGSFRTSMYADIAALQNNSEIHHLLGQSGRIRQFLSWRLRNLFIPENEELAYELRNYLDEITRK